MWRKLKNLRERGPGAGIPVESGTSVSMERPSNVPVQSSIGSSLNFRTSFRVDPCGTAMSGAESRSSSREGRRHHDVRLPQGARLAALLGEGVTALGVLVLVGHPVDDRRHGKHRDEARSEKKLHAS